MGKGNWQEPHVAEVQKDRLPFVIDAKVTRVHVGLGEISGALLILTGSIGRAKRERLVSA